jgi:hypothetical protein
VTKNGGERQFERFKKRHKNSPEEYNFLRIE